MRTCFANSVCRSIPAVLAVSRLRASLQERAGRVFVIVSAYSPLSRTQEKLDLLVALRSLVLFDGVRHVQRTQIGLLCRGQRPYKIRILLVYFRTSVCSLLQRQLSFEFCRIEQVVPLTVQVRLDSTLL